MSEQQAIYGGTPAKPSADNLADRLAKEIAFQDSLKRRPLRLMRLLDEVEATLREQERRLAACEALAERWGKLRVAYGIADMFQQPKEYLELRAALGK